MLVEDMEGWRPDTEDGLALFQHMRAREHKNYINNCNDDIEEIKYEGGLSTFRISGSTPTRKGGSLLISDMEKNDYDWLLTPPGTPLFPSLDQETGTADFPQRATSTYSASPKKSLKNPLKSLSDSRSPHQRSAASPRCKNTGTYTSPSLQRTYAVSPARPSASSRRARSPSASPAPSLTRSRHSTEALSTSRSPTPTGQSLLATASKSTPRSLAPTLCRNNTSLSSASRRDYLAPKGPRRSLSPSLGLWEPIMEVLSTEPLPNLRTSPSRRSLQRGKSEDSGQGVWSNSTFTGGHDAHYAIELLAQRNRNRGAHKPSEASRFLTRCEDGKGGISSPARRQRPPTMCSKERLSNSTHGKLIDRGGPLQRSPQSLFRPLMSTAPITTMNRTYPDLFDRNISSPSVVASKPGFEGPQQHMMVSPVKDSTHDCNAEGAEQLINTNRSVDNNFVNLDGTVSNENEHEYASHNCTMFEKGMEPTNPEGKPREKLCLAGVWDRNQTCVFEDASNDSVACAMVLSSDVDVSIRESDPVKMGVSHEHRKLVLLSHSLPRGESQVPNVRYGREKLSECSREDNKMSASDQLQPSYGACLSSFHPVRRKLCMKSIDMAYGKWNIKKAGSFDVSTSDSYSCSESFDSSYIDNHTEKFSEDLSEVDSMSQTGCSLSTSSITNHSAYNHTCADKPFVEILTELEVGDGRFMHLSSVSGALEARGPATKYCMIEQGIPGRKQLQASTTDLSQLWTTSVDSKNDPLTGRNDGLSVEDVLSFMDARNLKLMEMKQLAHEKSHAKPHVKGEHAAAEWRLGDSGAVHSSKSTSPGAVDLRGRTEWDDGLKEVQEPTASLLGRNITLEEATDTILFCSSIIHEVVYAATTLGEERRSPDVEEEPSGICRLIAGPSPVSRTPKAWSHTRDPHAFFHGGEYHPDDCGLQARAKLKGSQHSAGNSHDKRKKRVLCGFTCCRVM